MTWLPLTRKRWEENNKLWEDCIAAAPEHKEALQGRILDEGDVLRRNISWLLEHLYVPNPAVGAVFAGSPRGHEEMSHEAINWGDLDVTGLEQHGDLWIVTLEEATDGQCPVLCRYVSEWLERWGWKAKVETTW